MKPIIAKVEQVLGVLRTSRLSILSVLAGWAVLTFSDQGRDVVRSLVADGGWKLFWFFVALLIWAHNAFYFARILLSFDEGPHARTGTTERGFATWFPRALGVIALVLVWVSFAKATSLGDALALSPGFLIVLAGYSLYVFGRRLFSRERVATHPGMQLLPTTPWIAAAPAIGTKADFRALDDLARGFVLACFAALVTLALACTLFPVQAGNFLGAAALLLLAAALWPTLAAFFAYIGRRYPLPILTFAVALAALFSLWNDNHALRTPIGERAPPDWQGAESLTDRFARWHAQRGRAPVVLVAAEGGGIRAAYWTAGVLGRLQDRCPSFERSVFAISSVSGGTLGSAIYGASLHERDRLRGQLSFEEIADRVLRLDLLSPAIGMALFPDLFQQMLPLPFAVLDRSRGIEMAWEDAWTSALAPARRGGAPPLQVASAGTSPGGHESGSALLAASFSELWGTLSHAPSSVPNLFFNAIRHADGRRFIVSNVPIRDEFHGAIDGIAQVGGDVRLSSAAHLSARFPYVSPLARIPGGEHVGDGGYYDNSGAETLIDIVEAIQRTDPEPHLVAILIRNSKPTIEHQHPSALLGELVGPPQTALHAIDGHTASALKRLEARLPRTTIHVKVEHDLVELPLGWSLSTKARQDLHAQLQRWFPGDRPPDDEKLRDLLTQLGDCEGQVWPNQRFEEAD